MEVFTHEQYVSIIHSLRLNAVLKFAEENSPYRLEQKKNVNKHIHDKLIKDILSIQEEVGNFLNFALNIGEINGKNELIRYSNKKEKTKDENFIYKLKDSEVYFLIVHQSYIDLNIHYKMLNYCIELMQDWVKNRSIKSNMEYPIIIPILIYTGKEKWEIPSDFSQKQIQDYIFENYKINFKYNIFDINKINKEELLKVDKLYSYAFLIAKSQNKNEINKYLTKIIDNAI